MNFWGWLFKTAAEWLAKPPTADGFRVGASHRIGWTGANMQEQEAAMAERLRAVCEKAVHDPDLFPSDVDGDGDLDTKCNFGVNRICREFAGITYLGGMRANEMLEFLKCHGDWRHIPQNQPQLAMSHANKGRLAIAAIYAEPCGHVAVVCPGEGSFSSKWGWKVPFVANVGPESKMGIIGANWAFGAPPEWFLHVADPES